MPTKSDELMAGPEGWRQPANEGSTTVITKVVVVAVARRLSAVSTKLTELASGAWRALFAQLVRWRTRSLRRCHQRMAAAGVCLTDHTLVLHPFDQLAGAGGTDMQALAQVVDRGPAVAQGQRYCPVVEVVGILAGAPATSRGSCDRGVDGIDIAWRTLARPVRRRRREPRPRIRTDRAVGRSGWPPDRTADRRRQAAVRRPVRREWCGCRSSTRPCS